MDLKPCPFCGGEADLVEWDSKEPTDLTDETYSEDRGDNICVHCPDCGAEGGNARSPSEYVNKWNTRKPEDLAAEKRRFAERLFFYLLAKVEKEQINKLNIQMLIEESSDLSDHFYRGS